MKTLEAKNLCKSYQNIPILLKISLEVEKGRSVAITGRSGEGKTTLLHLLAGLDSPDQGEIYIDSEKMSPSNSIELRQKKIGMIFQSPNLLEDFSLIDNVLMAAKIARLPASKERGLELLEKVGLSHMAYRAVKFLSGGEKQRVAIARALCNNPSILLADEPTGNLDLENKKKIMSLLLSFPITLILVTHDLELAKLCDRHLSLEKGALSPSQLQ